MPSRGNNGLITAGAFIAIKARADGVDLILEGPASGRPSATDWRAGIRTRTEARKCAPLCAMERSQTEVVANSRILDQSCPLLRGRQGKGREKEVATNCS